MKITKDIFNVGVNDQWIDLLEGQYAVPKWNVVQFLCHFRRENLLF